MAPTCRDGKDSGLGPRAARTGPPKGLTGLRRPGVKRTDPSVGASAGTSGQAHGESSPESEGHQLHGNDVGLSARIVEPEGWRWLPPSLLDLLGSPHLSVGSRTVI